MVWHSVVLPGTQTVTLVKSVLTLPPVAVGPPSTTTPATWGAAVPGEAEDPDPELPPPPQESNVNAKAQARPERSIRINPATSGCRPKTCRPAALAVDMHVP